jgi:long-chain acyl-CoA synthetase
MPFMTASAPPKPASLEYWAEHAADEIALSEGERSLSYRQWNTQADAVAEALSQRGIVRGDVVVLRLQIRIEWAIIGAALAKLECALLGLNWRLTPTEAQYVLSSSGATALICDDPEPAALLSALQGLPLKLRVCIDGADPNFVPYRELLGANSLARFAPGDPALIVYTSGTTGLPKGVTMGRRSAHYSETQVQEYVQDVRRGRTSGLEGASTLITMPMHHGSGPSQLWGALHGKRRVVLMRRFDPEQALALIQKHRICDWGSVPTMLKRMAALSPDTLARYDVSSIRHISVGAAPVPYALKEWVLGYFGERVLTEGYGSTETGMVTRLPPDMQRAKPGSSGRPYRHVSIEIRDAEGRALPAGQVGEIWVRTPTTLQGYLNSTTLDSDQLDLQGFFRIGDVGYVDADGFLYITDRTKDLIISGGVNIYPAEIEKVLLGHPDVLDAAVIGVPDDEFGEQVKAIVELKPGRVLNALQLAEFAAPNLASYKRPKSIDFIDELPRNTMGKVLKRELRTKYWKNRERTI